MRKLEIGAGPHPKEGYEHLDVRRLAHVEYIANARALPFADQTYDEVFSNHVIEHFGWREVRAVLTEWLRVLKAGGHLDIITPDFYRLWENLITQRDFPVPENPQFRGWKGGPIDSQFVAYVTGGSQDYPENTHLAHYTPDWYRETLEDLGCEVEIKFHGQNHPSPSIEIIVVKR